MTVPEALPGPKLKAERERRGLSAQKAADEMHLDRWVIDALEADDYQRIGPTVYAKGHLKKYAALLGLPAADILGAFESLSPARAAAPAAGPSMLLHTRDDSGSSGRLPLVPIGGVVAGALLLGLLWWRPWHGHVRAANASPPSAAARVQAPPPAGVVPGEAAAAKPIDSGLVSSATAAPVVNTASPATAVPAVGTGPAAAGGGAEAAVAPVPGAGHARLRLSFSADSWVDIHDASGKRTFAGNGLANSVKTVSGVAPLRVYLGMGSGVQLEINDRAVAIGPQFFAGDVARFEAGADGVLRRDSHPEPTHGAPPRNPRPPG